MISPVRRASGWGGWPVLLTLAGVALALRLFRLSVQSFWYDEAFSVYLAQMSLGEIAARTAADIQPPLYYALLHYWMGLAGASEFAVRYLSAFFGVLTVPLMYAAARRLWDRPTAVIAALLTLLSPLYLWYSQEARMYTLITFLGLLSSYLLLRVLWPRAPASLPRGARGVTRFGAGRPVAPPAQPQTPSWMLVLALALVNAAALYTHYFAAVIIAFQFVFLLFSLLWGGGRNWARAAVGLLAGPALFLPWAPFMAQRLGEDVSYWRGELKLDEAIRHIFIIFAVGESALEEIARLLAAGWLFVLVLGLVAYVLTHRPPRRLAETDRGALSRAPYALSFAILYLAVPLALLLFLFARNPKFNARYLMLASPGFYLIVAAGLGALAQALRPRSAPRLDWSARVRGKAQNVEPGGGSSTFGRVLAGLVLLVGGGYLLYTGWYADSNAYFDPAFTKADFRGVANYVAAHAATDDAVILVSGHLFPAFDYYFHNPALPELRLPDDPTLNAEHVVGYAAADDLNRALAGKRGAWVVLWQDEVVDPNGMVPQLLSTRGVEQKLEAAFWQVRLRYWRIESNNPFVSQPEVQTVHVANFKDQVRLLGLSTPAPTPADTGASFTLYWQASAELKEDYLLSLRIVDAQGNQWGKQDRRPGGYNYPATRWKPGEYIAGAYTVPLLPGTPAGDYFAIATIYTKQNESGLDVLAPSGAPVGRSVKVGPIRVLPALKPTPYADIQVQNHTGAPLGSFTVLGYEFGRKEASTGESIPMTVFWRADEKPDADYTFRVLFDQIPSQPLPLANAQFPTSAWREGEVVRGQYLVQIPPEAAAGTPTLRLTLARAGMDTGQAMNLASFTVVKTDRNFTAPTPGNVQPAVFGDHLLSLAGYDLSASSVRAGDALTVTLHWKAEGKMDRPYTVFVHLLDKDSQVKAQRDAQPLNGGRPTQTWVPGEYLSDAYPLQVKPDSPPGEYRIEIGWYDAADPTFARLQALDDKDNPVGDHVILKAMVTIK